MMLPEGVDEVLQFVRTDRDLEIQKAEAN